ncbi:membrane-spanning 4-domains subfamily A member 6D-like isoform X3 [Grammomys surdaster]|uniref:membrane-spanning 4-domains subfamily A member 6D-like isoform X3 n=1 Tax=Grammomys surdaster TaxID=491861 RepID=UPI0010A04385|nr:membrane-spanning 4-domains subfamily A member 6D-like isoform X3 [Grammomys surdaster]
MITQVVTNETVTVISPNGISFPQTDKPQPTHQRKDSLKKHLKAEIKVIAFVISGILSVITEKKMTKPLVHSSLALNILSVLYALTGIIILSVSLAALEPALQQCQLAQQLATTPHYYRFFRPEPSNKSCFIAKAALTGVFSLMLISSVLELGLAVLIAMLRWKQSRSAFSGNVLFLSQDSKNKSSISSESLCNPDMRNY